MFLPPDQVHFLPGPEFQVDNEAKEQLLGVLTTTVSKPSLQVARFNGRWFALNSSLLVLYRILSSRGHMALIPVHQVSPSLLPNYLLKPSTGLSSTSFSSCCSAVDSISASVTRRQQEEENVIRCKGRPEPNSSSDEEEEDTDEDDEDDEDAESEEEEELESSGDDSTWTWSGCSSRSRPLIKLQHSHCKCNGCCESHFETRHMVGRAKDCTMTSCGGKGGAGDVILGGYLQGRE